MESPKNKKPDRKLWPTPILFALALTVIVFILGGITFYEKTVWSLSGNAIGDFFAGFSGALSFVWIIATIFLQKEELALQREEVSRLADEAKSQNISLLVAAKTNFQVRFRATIDAFYQNHISTLAMVNRDLSWKYATNSKLIAGLQEFVNANYSSDLQINKSNIESMYLKVKGIEGRQARLKFEVELSPVKADPLSGSAYCNAIMSIQIEQLGVRRMLKANKVSVEEIEMLIQEACLLGLLPTVRSLSLIRSDDADVRSIQANAIMQCLLNEISAN